MMAAILNFPMIDSDTLFSSQFTQKHFSPLWHDSKIHFTHSFWLNLMMAAILNSANLAFSHISFSLSNSLTLAKIGSHYLHKKELHSFIVTQLDDGSHLEFCHVGFRHCHLGFRHLVIFSQIHSKPNSLQYWLWLKLIQSDSKSFIFT